MFPWSLRELPEFTKRFGFDSGYHFEYPDAVRGIYVTGHSAGGAKFHSLVNLIDNTDLNAMVIDIEDDWGNVTLFPMKIPLIIKWADRILKTRKK